MTSGNFPALAADKACAVKKRIIRKRKRPAGNEPRDTAHPPLPQKPPIDPVKVAQWLEAWDENKKHLPPYMGCLRWFELRSASRDADLHYWKGRDLAVLSQKLRRLTGPGLLFVTAEGIEITFALNAGGLIEALIDMDNEMAGIVVEAMAKPTH